MTILKHISISTRIADITLTSCCFNASGAQCTTADELNALLASNAGALVTKSCTMHPREGNPEPRYRDTAWGSINAMGLPNKGINYYLDYVAQQGAIATKPIFLSVAGLTLEENIAILQLLRRQSAISAVELNLSCPNLPNKPQVAYDMERTRLVLAQVAAIYDRPWGVKLPPYFDVVHFEQMAAILNDFPIQFVTCINSIGNGLVVDSQTESPLIKPKNGLGGIGGDYIKPTALANVYMFRQLLRDNIAVIGCGGIKSGEDAFEHILCGAHAVQIGTQLMKEGIYCFARIQAELQAIMAAKGYATLDDFRGKLKPL